MLTQSQVKEILSYDPESGELRRVNGRGRPLGSKRGYFQVKICREVHYGHRLAWLYVYGEWPAGQLDHIDGNPGNNAISNLRDVTQSQNNANTRKHYNNQSGFKGVSWHRARRKWRAELQVNRKRKHLGLFDTAIEAASAYDKAASEKFGEHARLNLPWAGAQ